MKGEVVVEIKRFFKCVRLEFMKFLRPKTFIVAGIAIIVMMFLTIFLFNMMGWSQFYLTPFGHTEEEVYEDTMEMYREKIADAEMMIKICEEDGDIAYVQIYRGVIARYEYMIQNNVPAVSNVSEENINFYMQYFGRFVLLFALVPIVFAAHIVCSEFSMRTASSLYSAPVKRYKIALAKFLTVVVFSAAFAIAMFIAMLLFGLIFYGAGGIDVPFVVRIGDNCFTMNGVLYVFLVALANILIFSTLGAVAMLLGYLLKKDIAAIAIMALIVGIGYITSMMHSYPAVNFFLPSQFNMTNFVFEFYRHYKLNAPYEVLLRCALWIALFISATFIHNRKMQIK